MTITIEPFLISVDGAADFDGTYDGRIMMTDHCTVIIVDTGNRKFVLKILNYSETLDADNYADWQRTFRKESEKLGAHAFSERGERGPFVPRVYSFEENARIFDNEEIDFTVISRHYLSPALIIEYIPGTKMNDRDCVFSRRFFSDLGFSLRYFNSRNFYHMDLSEKNMIVGADGRVWLIDFTGAFLFQPQGVLLKGYKPFHLDTGYLAGRNSENLTPHGCETFQAKMLLDIFSRFFCSRLVRSELDGRIAEISDIVLQADNPLSRLETEMSALMNDYFFSSSAMA